jgi:YD repeat-containing protein
VYVVRNLEEGVYEIEQPTGLTELTQYDVRGRCLLKVVYDTRTAWPVTQRAYRYSGEGDLLAIEDANVGTTWVEHDAAHRLSRVVHATGRVDMYGYDDGDNLVRMPGPSAAP